MECRSGRDVESLEATELRLGLPGTDDPVARRTKRRQTPESDDCALRGACAVDQQLVGRGTSTPPAKAHVVGWPPVPSFRKNNIRSAAKKAEAAEASPGLFVKVGMDGAPYLRKIDLNVYKGYKQLCHALRDMFKCFSTGENGSEFAIAYEDKDGDWMLAGDVPWEMFTSSCKRLRIMKGSEAKGLAPSM